MANAPVPGACLCGAVRFEIDAPTLFCAHCHCSMCRRAHGAGYVTWIGVPYERFRMLAGEERLVRYRSSEHATRSFCGTCGTPLTYERVRSPHMVNIPRALFESRTGRQPLYHASIDELQDWAYTGERLVPLKGFPGIVWERPRRKKRLDRPGMF